jgi:hypothetical protein
MKASPVIAGQQLSKDIPLFLFQSLEGLLDVPSSMQCMSYKGKTGDLFLPEHLNSESDVEVLRS